MRAGLVSVDLLQPDDVGSQLRDRRVQPRELHRAVHERTAVQQVQGREAHVRTLAEQPGCHCGELPGRQVAAERLDTGTGGRLSRVGLGPGARLGRGRFPTLRAASRAPEAASRAPLLRAARPCRAPLLRAARLCPLRGPRAPRA